MDDVSVDRCVFQASSRTDRLLEGMKDLRANGRLCDIILRLGSNEISAHRLVLATSSPYFRAMLTNSLAEATQEAVTLYDLDYGVVKSLVDFMYTSEIEIDTDRVQTLLQTAALFQLDDLVKACGNFILGHLHHSNCVGIRNFAFLHGCWDLHKAADAHVHENFIAVSNGDEFLHLSIDEVSELLSSDTIIIQTEEDAMEAALRWLNHDPSSRQTDARHILASLRLAHLPPLRLVERLSQNALFRDDAECLQMILDSLAVHCIPPELRQSTAINCEARKSTLGCIVAVGGMDANKGGTTVEVYDPRVDEWRVVTKVAGKRLQFGVAVVDGWIYIVGGRDGLKTLNSVQKYEPAKRKWYSAAHMCTHRHGVGVASLCGPIYAVGGHDGWSYLNSVERFDTETDQWSFVASMKVPRSTVGVGILDGRLYAVGGRDSISCVRTVEYYSPHTNRWTEVAPLAHARAGLGVSVLHGKLYAIGGHDNNVNYATVERFDPRCDQWTTLVPMANARNSLGTVAFGGKIYAVGGFSGVTYLNSVEAYDDEKGEWDKMADMKIGRAGAGVVVLKERDLLSTVEV